MADLTPDSLAAMRSRILDTRLDWSAWMGTDDLLALIAAAEERDRLRAQRTSLRAESEAHAEKRGKLRDENAELRAKLKAAEERWRDLYSAACDYVVDTEDRDGEPESRAQLNEVLRRFANDEPPGER